MRNASARQLADRMVELGMLAEQKSAEVLAWINKWGEGDDSANDPLSVRDLVGYLPEFGVAVSIHSDDVGFVDDYYRSVLEEAVLECTGGAVVVTDVTLLETDDGDEWLYFVRNDEPVWWTMEHQSQDYVDMMTIIENFGDLAPGGDDPRRFYMHRPETMESGQDQYFVFATREQAMALRDEFGIGFDGLDRTTSGTELAEAADFLARWKSGMDERLLRWREEFLPKDFPFDFSLESLNTLERLVLNRFPDGAAVNAAEADPFVVGAVGYVGETWIRVESGGWEYRAHSGPFGRVAMVRAAVPITFSVLEVPFWLLRRVAEDREFGVLVAPAAEFREASELYETALRALASDLEDDEDDDLDED